MNFKSVTLAIFIAQTAMIAIKLKALFTLGGPGGRIDIGLISDTHALSYILV